MSIEIMNRVLACSCAKGSDLVLRLVLANRADEDGVCWPGVEYLRLRTRLKSERQVIRMLRQAEADGELYVIEHGGGRKHTNKYILVTGFSKAEIFDVLRRRFDITPLEANAIAERLVELQKSQINPDVDVTLSDENHDIETMVYEENPDMQATLFEGNPDILVQETLAPMPGDSSLDSSKEREDPAPDFDQLLPKQVRQIPEIKIFTAVTSRFPGEPQWPVIYDAVRQIMRARGLDRKAVVEYLRPFYREWAGVRGHRSENLGWLVEWAVGGEIPRPGQAAILPAQKTESGTLVCDLDCPICAGQIWTRLDVPKDDPSFGKMQVCPNAHKTDRRGMVAVPNNAPITDQPRSADVRTGKRTIQSVLSDMQPPGNGDRPGLSGEGLATAAPASTGAKKP